MDGFLGSKLIFVYNANSGTWNSWLSSAHKVLSPATYNCSLCAVTFGVFTENKVWKAFREQSTTEFVFLHKNEFAMAYPSAVGSQITFPVIYAEKGGELQVFVGAEALKTMTDAEELIQVLTARMG